jgi:hypothetical protein
MKHAPPLAGDLVVMLAAFFGVLSFGTLLFMLLALWAYAF